MSPAWLVALSLALGAAGAKPPEASTALPAEVQRFAASVSSAQGLTLADHWQVPGESGPAWLLRFQDPEDPGGHLVPLALFVSSDQVWVRRALNAGQVVTVSPDAAHRRFTLTLAERARTYGLREGRPVNVVVTREGKLDDFGRGREVQDWDALTFQRTLVEGQGRKEKTVETDQGAILLVTTDASAPLPRTWTRLTDGQASWHGAKDASLQLHAEPVEAGVALRLQVKDNDPVPVPAHGSARAFAAADHFELWWRSPHGLRQVGVGLDAKGQVRLRALHLKTPGLPLPTATLEDQTIVVQFDSALLGGDRAIAQGVPFTVAYADQGPNRKKRSVISTSAFQFRPSTLGTLIALPGFSRWPVEDDDSPWCPYRAEAKGRDWSDC
jgi:hypothetical protein